MLTSPLACGWWLGAGMVASSVRVSIRSSGTCHRMPQQQQAHANVPCAFSPPGISLRPVARAVFSFQVAHSA
jgi:hypothetical protein